MKKSEIKKKFIDKIELFGLLFFLGGLFLFDVNLNNIAAYGLNVTVGLLGAKEIAATSCVWTGFILALIGYGLVVIRSMYKRQKSLHYTDALFGAIGVIGLLITLSGGILLFWHNNALAIPFYGFELTRITYYHIGIALDIISLLYFAITK